MKDDKIEKALSGLNLQAPSLQTRQRVLDAAQKAWQHSKNPVKIRVTLRWTWCYAAAASLLIVLNMAFSATDRHWKNIVYLEPATHSALMQKEYLEILVEIGVDPEHAFRLNTLVVLSISSRNLEAEMSRRQDVFSNYMKLTNGG